MAVPHLLVNAIVIVNEKKFVASSFFILAHRNGEMFSCTIKFSYKKKLSRKIFFAEENLQFCPNTIESFKFSAERDKYTMINDIASREMRKTVRDCGTALGWDSRRTMFSYRLAALGAERRPSGRGQNQTEHTEREIVFLFFLLPPSHRFVVLFFLLPSGSFLINPATESWNCPLLNASFTLPFIRCVWVCVCVLSFHVRLLQVPAAAASSSSSSSLLFFLSLSILCSCFFRFFLHLTHFSLHTNEIRSKIPKCTFPVFFLAQK